MKPSFSKEQLEYLNKCASFAYGRRWKIGKDYFRGLEAFLPYFEWSLSKDEEFEELLDKKADHDMEWDPKGYEEYHPF